MKKKLTERQKAERQKAMARFLEMQTVDRFRALIPQPDVTKRMLVTMIGAGAIGSYTAVLLAKMGFRRFVIWDDDTVEIENIGVQLYDRRHLRKAKVDAFEDVLKRVAPDVRVAKFKRRFGERSPLGDNSDVIICSVDNIPTRQMVWERAKKLDRGRKIRLYVDPRMGADTAQVFATGLPSPGHEFSKAQLATYEKSFHKNVPPAPCGKHSTPTNSALAGTLVANTVRKWLMDEPTESQVVINVNTLNTYKGGVADGDEGVGGRDPRYARADGLQGKSDVGKSNDPRRAGTRRRAARAPRRR